MNDFDYINEIIDTVVLRHDDEFDMYNSLDQDSESHQKILEIASSMAEAMEKAAWKVAEESRDEFIELLKKEYEELL